MAQHNEILMYRCQLDCHRILLGLCGLFCRGIGICVAERDCSNKGQDDRERDEDMGPSHELRHMRIEPAVPTCAI